MCIYKYTCMHADVHIQIHMYTCQCVLVYTNILGDVHIQIYLWMCIYKYTLQIYLFMCIYKYTCMHVDVYIQIHMYTRQCVLVYIQINVSMRIYTQIYVFMCIYTNRHSYMLMCAGIHKSTYWCVYTTCCHVYIHAPASRGCDQPTQGSASYCTPTTKKHLTFYSKRTRSIALCTAHQQPKNSSKPSPPLHSQQHHPRPAYHSVMCTRGYQI